MFWEFEDGLTNTIIGATESMSRTPVVTGVDHGRDGL